MLKLSSAVAGMRLGLLWGSTQVFTCNYYINITPEIKPWEETLKGSIATTPSGYSNFNNCDHKEAYGTVYLPSKTKDGKWITLGPNVLWKWQDMPAGYFSRYEKDLGIRYNQPYSLTAGYQARQSGTIWMSAVVICGNYGYRKNISPKTWDSGIQTLSNPGNYSTWTRFNVSQTFDIIKTNSKNECVDELRNLLNSTSVDQSILRNKYQGHGFADAMDSIQDLPTTSIALQLGIDGLICQAATGLMSNAISGFTKAGARSKLTNLAKIDLAANYGVLAPLRDYIDLFNTLKEYYTDGIKPFFNGSTCARQTVTEGKWQHQLVFGICWDYFNSSTIQDTFGILYQAGLLGLSPSQVWDLVPFSFAVDWLVNLSTLFESLDAQLNAIRYPIKYVWQTVKSTTTLTWRGQEFTYVYYTRVASRSIPPHISYWEIGDLKGTLSTSNAAEAVSLVVSMFL